ncbi:alpha-N-arabinofuranosidase, partial [bacterium]
VVSRASASGEIIVKVVNVSKQAIDTRITIDGVASVEPNGEASVLTSADPRDENTIAEPLKIVPRTTPVEGIAKEFQYTFAPNSVTIMRLKGSL